VNERTLDSLSPTRGAEVLLRPMSVPEASASPGAAAGRLLRPLVLQALSRVEEGRLDLHWPDGRVRSFGSPDATLRARVHVVRDDLFRRVALNGEIGIGEAYAAGDWWSEDPAGVVEIGCRNRHRLNFGGALSALSDRFEALRHRWRANSRSGSRHNIRAHYDLGNDFYALFLGDSWSYSSAVYEEAGQSTLEAQRTKHRRIFRKLGLRPHHHVLEIGCGWGGFALQAVRETGCRVTGLTLSRAQYDFARARIAASEVADRIDIRLLDYRDIGRAGTPGAALTGFDRVVSIEMFEAVGFEYYDAYFDALRRALLPDGAAFVQTITVPDAGFEAYRRGSDWIRKHIFPGSLLASVAEVERSLSRVGELRLADREEIGSHYPKTLDDWRRAFHRRLDDARALGFDERFLRAWDYYLASCAGAFRAGVIGNAQLVIRKSG
jgi:cyclopropane-fatty-acyl-phospholipid synthase